MQIPENIFNPHGMILCCFTAPGCRVIPEKSVSERGVKYRNRRFGIIMLQITGAALAVKNIFLLLPKSVKMFSGICIKNHLNLIVVALHLLWKNGGINPWEF